MKGRMVLDEDIAIVQVRKAEPDEGGEDRTQKAVSKRQG